jgi:hypothetical protein
MSVNIHQITRRHFTEVLVLVRCYSFQQKAYLKAIGSLGLFIVISDKR